MWPVCSERSSQYSPVCVLSHTHGEQAVYLSFDTSETHPVSAVRRTSGTQQHQNPLPPENKNTESTETTESVTRLLCRFMNSSNFSRVRTKARPRRPVESCSFEDALILWFVVFAPVNSQRGLEFQSAFSCWRIEMKFVPQRPKHTESFHVVPVVTTH